MAGKDNAQLQAERAYKVFRYIGKSGIAAVATGGASAILAEMLDLLVTDPAEKRRDRLLFELAVRIDELEQAGRLTVESLIGSEEVAALIIRTTQAAVRSSGDQKLVALRETALKGLVAAREVGSGPAQVVVGLLDRMTEHHVVLLAWEDRKRRNPFWPAAAYNDPADDTARRSKFYGQPVFVDPAGLLDPVQLFSPGRLSIYVERAEQQAFQLAHADLIAMGLLEPVLKQERELRGREVVQRITPEVRGYKISKLGETVCAYILPLPE